MRLLKKARHTPVQYDARTQRQRIVSSHRVKRCNTCTYEVPEADIVVEDGAEHCPLCTDTLTAQWHEAEQRYVSDVEAESARRLVIPPQLSRRALKESRPAAVTSITDSAGNLLSQTSQLRMVRNSAVTVLVSGQYLSSAVTFTYPTGISNNATPVVNSTTLMTLSLIAASGMATGSYSLTINDGVSTYGHVYTNIFGVR